ncbi:peptidoglycan-binding protein [Kaistia granuli]|uniref:peptidoglycan-binding protein n=1 Tax=Kaistia granuli TaxID=363259 RepID=UPI00035F5920|nr:peptidoglycan-binding protein [Kaistia granuli]
MTTLDIQKRLKELGFDPGELDGKSGSKTVKAIKAFQIANGLSADGRVGPNTSAALFPDDANETEDAVAPVAEPSAAEAWPKQVDCMRHYGGVGLFQTRLALPYPMRLAWDKGVVVRSISVHEKVHDSAARAFAKIASRYNEAQRKDMGLDLFGGSLNVRKMRGGSGYSMHSWGIAIDFDPDRNQLKWDKERSRLARPDAADFWSFWEEEGWVSLGRSRNFDWMHVQAARL